MFKDNIDPAKAYEKYMSTTGSFDYLSLGINDNFLENRVEVLARPIVSLEGMGANLHFKNFGLSVFLHLDRNIDYLVGEFNFSDDEFKKVAREFCKAGYYGEVFVAYGDYYIDKELEAAKKYKGAYDPCKFQRINKGRLYRRNRHTDGSYEFHSILSGVPHIKLDINRLVRVSYEGVGVFLQGLELAKEYVSIMGSYMDLLKLSLTRYKIIATDDTVKRNTIESVNGGSLFYEGSMDMRKDAEVKAEEMCLPEHPQMLLDTGLNYYAEGCRRMGFVFGSESKSERLTSGEHYRALKMTSNIQNYFLMLMQAFTRDVRQLFPKAPYLEITLAYDVTGQGVPDNNAAVKKKWSYKGNKEAFEPVDYNAS